MKLQAEIMLNPEKMEVTKSGNDMDLIKTLKKNKMCRRIMGYGNMETLIRKFQVQFNGIKRTIWVQPQHLSWFW